MNSRVVGFALASISELAVVWHACATVAAFFVGAMDAFASWYPPSQHEGSVLACAGWRRGEVVASFTIRRARVPVAYIWHATVITSIKGVRKVLLVKIAPELGIASTTESAIA